MEAKIVAKIADDLKTLLTLLVDRDYEALERKTKGVRLSANDIRNVIEEYGRKLVFPPPAAFGQLDLIEVQQSLSKQYSLRFDLWTEQEGRSDLSLEATVIEEPPNGLRWELDNIHVL